MDALEQKAGPIATAGDRNRLTLTTSSFRREDAQEHYGRARCLGQSRYNLFAGSANLDRGEPASNQAEFRRLSGLALGGDSDAPACGRGHILARHREADGGDGKKNTSTLSQNAQLKSAQTRRARRCPQPTSNLKRCKASLMSRTRRSSSFRARARRSRKSRSRLPS